MLCVPVQQHQRAFKRPLYSSQTISHIKCLRSRIHTVLYKPPIDVLFDVSTRSIYNIFFPFTRIISTAAAVLYVLVNFTQVLQAMSITRWRMLCTIRPRFYYYYTAAAIHSRNRFQSTFIEPIGCVSVSYIIPIRTRTRKSPSLISIVKYKTCTFAVISNLLSHPSSIADHSKGVELLLAMRSVRASPASPQRNGLSGLPVGILARLAHQR